MKLGIKIPFFSSLFQHVTWYQLGWDVDFSCAKAKVFEPPNHWPQLN
jgi:hypothetical protein